MAITKDMLIAEVAQWQEAKQSRKRLWYTV